MFLNFSSKKENLIRISILVFFLSFFWVNLIQAEQQPEIYFFWGEGCPYCELEKIFLENLKSEYPNLKINEFEIYNNQGNLKLLEDLAEAYQINLQGIPITFIGDEVVVGFGSANTTGETIENLVQECSSSNCLSPLSRLNSSENEPNHDSQENDICVNLFIQSNCDPCQNLITFLENQSQQEGFDLKIYNISESEKNAKIYQEVLGYYNISSTGFPILFIGETYLVGEERIKENLKSVVTHCQKTSCPCPLHDIEHALTQLPRKDDFMPDNELLKLNFFGKTFSISAGSSLPWLTVGLGLIDGINPCTFSVLFFLLTYLLAIGSRKKAVKVGLVFSLTVFFVYLIFMLGILNLISIIGAINKIKILVAIIALIAGLIMLKDFFYYGRWISLEIPQKAKPVLQKLIKRGTIPSAIVLGILASLVELPCTSGIPLVYTTILAQQKIVGSAALLYLVAYNLFYIAPLLIIIGLVALVLVRIDAAEAWRIRLRKYMRLLSGLILIFLALAILLGWM